MNTQDLAALAAVTHASKPLIQKGADLIGELLGEPMRVAGGMLGDQIYAWRMMRAAELAAECRAVLQDRGISARRLPPSFLLPFIDDAVRSSESLQSLWANLLASAVENDADQHPIFRSILSRLSAEEARIIHWLHINRELPVAVITLSHGEQIHWTRTSPLGLSKSSRIEFLLEHLSSLDVLSGGGPVPEPPPLGFENLLESPEIEHLARSSRIPRVRPFALVLELNLLGREFATACLPREA